MRARKREKLTGATSAPGAGVAFRAGRANDFALGVFHAETALGTRAGAAVVRTATQGVAVETRSAALAVFPDGVVLADTAARVDVARLRMAVAVARDASRERTAVRRLTTETRGARLAKLTHVT